MVDPLDGVDGEPLVDLTLYGRVQPAECSWSLDGATLRFSLPYAVMRASGTTTVGAPASVR